VIHENSEDEDRDIIQALLLKISHLHLSKMHQQLLDTGIHPRQMPMISLLGRNPGMSQREIADKLHIKPPTVTVSIRRMEKTGFITKKADDEDQRVIRIYLSDKGKELELKLMELLKKNKGCLFQGFSEAECYLMKNFLQQMVANLESMPVYARDVEFEGQQCRRRKDKIRSRRGKKYD